MPHPRRHPADRDRARGPGRVRTSRPRRRPTGPAGLTRPGTPGRATAGTTGSGPRGREAASTRPGRPGGPDGTGRAGRTTNRTPGRGGAEPAHRPRLTGRAAVLVLVLVVLATSYASSLRAYLDQRAQLDDLSSTISSREAEIAGLESERDRWRDPAYVRIQARDRLGYVRPGETSYVATRDGVPIDGERSLDESDAATEPPDQAWYGDLWDSTKLAGDPPRTTTPPADRIDGRSAAE